MTARSVRPRPRPESAAQEAPSRLPVQQNDHGNAANVASVQAPAAEPSLLAAFAASAAPPEWAKVEAGELVLRRGSRGPAVEHLQQLLAQAGHDVDVDGIFGGGTRAAVMAYQQAAGLGVDGAVGKNSARVLAGGTPVSDAQQQQEDAKDAKDAAETDGVEQQGPVQGPGEALQVGVSAGSFESVGLRPEVMSVALDVFRNAWKGGQTTKTTYTIIDFSMPSTEKRMFIFDVTSGDLLFNELVTHGSKSGGNIPSSFSNTNESHQSSIGLAKTAETYQSSKFGGTALRMDGLEEGYNDNMRDRAIVMHQATYATPEAIKANGGRRLGRSQGCPAMDPRVAGEVIETIKNGSLVFSYYPDPEYMRESEFVNG